MPRQKVQRVDRFSFSDMMRDASVDLINRNDTFCTLMRQAIEQGREHPPMDGIDTHPCTKNPVFVPHRIKDPLIISSVAGSVADIGQ